MKIGYERLTLQNYQLDWWFVQNIISEKALETIHIELLLDQNKANSFRKDKTANEILDDAEALHVTVKYNAMLCKKRCKRF
jgi:hypothetical protein